MATSRPSHWANAAGTLFKNPWPSAVEPSLIELYQGKSPITWYDESGTAVEDVTIIKPDWGAAELRRKRQAGGLTDGHLIATWLGHAGVLVEIPKAADGGDSPEAAAKDSAYLVFDPIFSYRAGPTQFTGVARFRESPVKAEDLPGCDAIFISHNHYDHLDTASVTGLLKTFPDTLWFVPRGNRQWFVDSGVSGDKIFEKDWWDDSRHALKGVDVKVTSVPAQHNSARGADKNKTLWCGWVIERFVKDVRRGAVYHAGDTGYRRMKDSPVTCPVFKEIGAKFGGFDLAFVPIWRGGTLGFISYWGLKLQQSAIAAVHHAYPADAIEIHKDVRSRHSVAVHFGTFVGSAAESKESVKEFREACKKSDVAKLDEEDRGSGRADLLNLGQSAVIPL